MKQTIFSSFAMIGLNNAALLLLLTVPLASFAQSGSSTVSRSDTTVSLNSANSESQTQAEIRAVITTWASAWQAQELDTYFLQYHKNFVPDGFASKAAWVTDRRKRISQPSVIHISLRELELASHLNNSATATFLLSYSRSGYADITKKEMRFRKSQGQWQIISERNLSVEAHDPGKNAQ